MGRDRAALEAEIEALRVELRSQWEANHTEHCGRDWPHPGRTWCGWPLPGVLGGLGLDERKDSPDLPDDVGEANRVGPEDDHAG